MKPLVPEDLLYRAERVDNRRIVLPWILRAQLWAKKSNHSDAVERMVSSGAPEAAVRIFQSPEFFLKAPSGAHTTLVPGYQSAVAGFVDSMQATSIFYRLVADRALQPASFHTRMGFSPTPPLAQIVNEAAPKPMVVGSLAFVTLTPQKVAAMDVITNEALDDVSARGQQHLMQRLQVAVGTGIDGAFLPSLVDTATTSIASTGPTATAARKDLRTLGLLVNTTGAGNFYAVCAPDVAEKAAWLGTTDGAPAFPQMSGMGGTLTGGPTPLPCLVSPGVPAGELYFLDGSGIVGASDTVETRASTQADALLSTTPSLPAAMSSLWQGNLTGFIVEASFGAMKLRDDCVAVLTGIDWGA